MELSARERGGRTTRVFYIEITREFIQLSVKRRGKLIHSIHVGSYLSPARLFVLVQAQAKGRHSNHSIFHFLAQSRPNGEPDGRAFSQCTSLQFDPT